MNIKKISYLLAGVALALSATSCKDFLDEMPDTRVELNSVEKARKLLSSSYPSYNPALVGELTSDNMEDNNTASETGVRFNLPVYARTDEETFCFEDVKSGSGSDTPSSIWEAYYGSMAGANAALDCLDKLQARVDKGEVVEDADKIDAVRAEALLLRAFSGFQLACYFCEQWRGPELSKSLLGVPYPKTPETTVKPMYERGTLAETFANIEADLLEALPLIDNSIYDIPKYHFNLQAAYSFAARFYLYMRDYRKVLEYCNRAFGGEGADVSQYMNDMWTNIGDYYDISDFGKYFNSFERPGNFLLTATYSTLVRHYSRGYRFAYTRNGMRGTIAGPGPTWDNFRWIDSNTKETFAMHPCFNGSCGVAGKSQYGRYFAGTSAEQFEYTNKIAGIGYAHNTRREFWAEETLLMRAEAKVWLGDYQGAIDDLAAWELPRRSCPSAVGSESKFRDWTIDRVRNFYLDPDLGYEIVKTMHIDEVTPSDTYSVNASNEPLLQCIQHMRRIETVHTGMRFLDLKRFGLVWSHKIGPENRIETMSLFDPRRAIQIPSEVLSADFQPNPRLQDEDDLLAAPCAPAQ